VDQKDDVDSPAAPRHSLNFEGTPLLDSVALEKTRSCGSLGLVSNKRSKT